MSLEYVEIANFQCFPAKGTRVPQKDTKRPELNSLSPGINLFIGPNGSGKTTLFNAIRLTFGREAHSSQCLHTQDVHRLGARKPERDFHDATLPWSVRAAVDWGPALRGDVRITCARPGATAEYVRLGTQGDRTSLDKDRGGALRDRVFDMGWPRRISGLAMTRYDRGRGPTPAFSEEGKSGGASPSNVDAYSAAWPRIRSAASFVLGIDLPTPPNAPSTTAEESFGFELLDESGQPLLECSDGVGHVLYLLMEIEKHPWPTTFLIEEPDVYLHPGLQRRFVDYLASRTVRDPKDDRPVHQFLVATHSPYIINAVVELQRSCPKGAPPPRLYQMRRDDKDVTVENVGNDPDKQWAVLQAIGHRPSDVLLPNGIIWVEGPSDRVYVRTWIEKYAEHANVPLVWGRDVEAVWYGGGQWEHLSAQGRRFWTDVTEYDLRTSLMSLATVNPNGAILIDRDKGPADSTTWDKKCHVKSEFESRKLVAWLDKSGPCSIEGYVGGDTPKEVLEIVRKAGTGNFVQKNKVKLRKPQAADLYRDSVEDLPWPRIVETSTNIECWIARLLCEIMRWRGDPEDEVARIRPRCSSEHGTSIAAP